VAEIAPDDVFVDVGLAPNRLDLSLHGIVRSVGLPLGDFTQNLAEEVVQFCPCPSRDELNHMLNLPR
jgi:hypothetical protein